MDTRWRIQLLGGLSAERGERRITRFHTRKTASLFAYLAFYSARAHPREGLADRFWPECDADAGRANLRVALSWLRRQLEPPGIEPGSVLDADRTGARLNAAAISTDVAAFEAELK